jgi:hypothetical protein
LSNEKHPKEAVEEADEMSRTENENSWKSGGQMVKASHS